MVLLTYFLKHLTIFLINMHPLKNFNSEEKFKPKTMDCKGIFNSIDNKNKIHRK